MSYLFGKGTMEKIKNISKMKGTDSLKTLTILHLFIYTMDLLYFVITESKMNEFVLIVIFILINSLSFTNIALTDPGYLSKKPYNTFDEEDLNFVDGTKVKIVYEKGTWLRFIHYKDEKYIQKYCEECNIFKTVGVSHCRECDYCVMEMDHHCFMFDTCIGRNNIGFFYLYIFSCLPILYYFKESTYEIHKQLQTSTKNYVQWIGFGCLFISIMSYLFISLNFFFVLYYIYLLLTGIKSRNFIKGYERKSNIKLSACLLKLITNKKVITCEDLR